MANTPVSAPADALIGDDALEVRAADVQVDDAPATAQVTGPASVAPATVLVNETAVYTDEVITDPASPLAVQIPDAGRGSLDLPIHALNGPTVEDVFAQAPVEKAAKK